MRDLSTARAGWLLALTLFARAWPAAPTAPEPCPQPVMAGPGEIRCLPASADAPRLEGAARRVFGLPIDPNRADAATLESLPGIGPARAGAILRERSRRPFRDSNDLERVRGLGPRRVEALRSFLAFDASLASAASSSVESPKCRSGSGFARSQDANASPTRCGEEP